MNSDNAQLEASFWLMLLLNTLAAVDVKGGPRKLPAPKAYVATIVAWAGLQLAADAGYERGAATAGWVFTLATLVLGPSGAKLTGFFTTIAKTYGAKATGTPPPTA